MVTTVLLVHIPQDAWSTLTPGSLDQYDFREQVDHFFFSFFSFLFSDRECSGFFFFSFLLSRFP
jgi:hypothetical protein